jgi:hypothetical protein
MAIALAAELRQLTHLMQQRGIGGEPVLEPNQ